LVSAKAIRVASLLLLPPQPRHYPRLYYSLVPPCLGLGLHKDSFSYHAVDDYRRRRHSGWHTSCELPTVHSLDLLTTFQVFSNPLPPLCHGPVVPSKGWNGTDDHHPHPTGHHPHATGKHPRPTGGIHHPPKHHDPHDDDKFVTVTSIIDEHGHVIQTEEVVNKRFVWEGPGEPPELPPGFRPLHIVEDRGKAEKRFIWEGPGEPPEVPGGKFRPLHVVEDRDTTTKRSIWEGPGDPPPPVGEGSWLPLHQLSEGESSVNKRFVWEGPGDPPPPPGEGLPFQLHEFTETTSKRDTWDDASHEGGSVDRRYVKDPPDPPPHEVSRHFWPLHGGLSKRFARRDRREEKMEKREMVKKERREVVSLGDEAEGEAVRRKKMGMREMDGEEVRRRKLGMKPKPRDSA